MHIDTNENFAVMHSLFFDVLAKKENERDKFIKPILNDIPYLNSSLFDKNELEKSGKEIRLLESKPLRIYADSILYKDSALAKELKLNTKNKDSSLPLLEYLFCFLQSYDFTTTPRDIQQNTKINHDKLINTAVLGLVFEKLNGYKEGSFYTPSFITSYMCRYSLEKVVINQFNEANGWNCATLDELKIRLDKLTDSTNGYEEANEIFHSIRICDPAVGSGHFLVSALNAMILLKYELDILCEIDERQHYSKLKNITLHLENDEIIVRDSKNNLFGYTLPAHKNIESHKIQKALFENKRQIIESCLFGVDINPNSCEICKLRLWIELLKYSYYTDIENRFLETLPNIDINIKCGNSLVSNISLDMTKDSLLKELKNMANENASLEFQAEFSALANDLQNKLPRTIESYKNAVNAYKTETNSDLKIIHKQTIQDSKNFIINLFLKTSGEHKDFKITLSDYFRKYGYAGIDDATSHIPDKAPQHIIKTLNDYIIAFNFHKTLDALKSPESFNQKDFEKLLASLEAYENLKNTQNAFEWRFEFPEVLDNNGDFKGFDLIIGNPPYMQVPKGVYSKDMYPYSEGKDKGKQNLYKVFVELGYNLGHESSLISFITQSSIMCDLSSQFTRELLLTKTKIHYVIEFKKDQQIFTNVIQGVCILAFTKIAPEAKASFAIAINNAETRMHEIAFAYITQKEILEFFPLYEFPLIKEGEMPIIAKVKKDKIVLKSFLVSSLQGNINTIHLRRIKSERETDIEIYKGANCHRYYLDKNFFYGLYNELTQKIIEKNYNQYMITTQNITGTTDKYRIHASFVESKRCKALGWDSELQALKLAL